MTTTLYLKKIFTAETAEIAEGRNGPKLLTLETSACSALSAVK
jgi:hypothetical protein